MLKSKLKLSSDIDNKDKPKKRVTINAPFKPEGTAVRSKKLRPKNPKRKLKMPYIKRTVALINSKIDNIRDSLQKVRKATVPNIMQKNYSVPKTLAEVNAHNDQLIFGLDNLANEGKKFIKKLENELNEIEQMRQIELERINLAIEEVDAEYHAMEDVIAEFKLFEGQFIDVDEFQYERDMILSTFNQRVRQYKEASIFERERQMIAAEGDEMATVDENKNKDTKILIKSKAIKRSNIQKQLTQQQKQPQHQQQQQQELQQLQKQQ